MTHHYFKWRRGPQNVLSDLEYHIYNWKMAYNTLKESDLL